MNINLKLALNTGLVMLAMVATTASFAEVKKPMQLNAASQSSPAKPKATSTEKDRPRGQLLYENHCGVCHDSSVHSRNPRKADSIDKIKYWVTKWSSELKLEWSADEIDDVTQFVNSKYYHFKK